MHLNNYSNSLKNIDINNHYINSGNDFSKQLLIADFLQKQDRPVLYFLSDEKNLNKWEKIQKYLGNNFQILAYYSQLIDISHNKIWKYFSLTNICELSLPSSEYDINTNIISLNHWDEIQIDSITQKLHDFWYKHSDHGNSGTFFVQWDTLNFTNIWASHTLKITFWWDTIEDIFIIDSQTNSSSSRKSAFIWNNIMLESFDNKNIFLEENKIYLNGWINILDTLDFYKYFENLIWISQEFIAFQNFSQSKRKEINLWINDLFLDNIDDLKHLFENKQFTKKIIYTKNTKSVKNFIEYNNFDNIEVFETTINTLKSFQTVDTFYICDDNISRIFVKKRINRKMWKKLDLLMQIKPWDYIVHVDHWIWIFQQIIEKQLNLWPNNIVKKEYIELLYKNDDKLFIPITEVNRINKYVWLENPKLTWLSTQEWEKKLKKVNENVEEIAHELLEAYAQREMEKWHKFLSIPEEETKFFNSFEYTYTDDQINIIQEIFTDMQSDKPMDRLVSGDVGFWKTEIAFAAIFKALANGKQAALISPLVVLAYEHYEKSLSRFAKFPFNIWVLTRFETAKNVASTLERLKEWKIDLIVGTHKLLSADVIFKDLWVLVIDEEHKFWVKDKDKIKSVRKNIDVLSLSATPIPRSLNMALNGIKSMSMLTTAPFGRQAIETIVSKYDDKVIAEAWKRELERWWQLFFIHNKVTTIETQKSNLAKIFPGKKIVIAHGQLPWDQLEKRILAFKKKEYDILLATTVIENGIDFSNVNTIFINDAYNFWISQIHQLRWRVWRSHKQWYCYLLFNRDKIKDDAAKRLKTIVDYSHLWAWFELAIKDLEIRWWWDILGIKQSGQQAEIWINLYLEMLENKIEELKRTGPLDTENKTNDTSRQKINTSVDLQLWAFIDNSFFDSELDKINFYREIESLEDLQDLENIISDFKEINPNISQETQNFFDLLEIKLKAPDYKITSIRKLWINYQIDFLESISLDELKWFLKLDSEVKFEVNKLFRLRAPVKKFKNEYDFLQYIKTLFWTQKSYEKKKIKLKKKA